MTLVLYNTMTRAMEPFAPLHAPRVTFYTCGPTVWNYAHIGNFRTFLFQDLLRRWLEQSGYEVCHIMNLTDVDDRTIKAAAAAQASLVAHTEPFVRAFFEDRDFLRIRPAHVYPRATTSIPAMVRLVEQLLAKGVAYKGDDGSVYFAIGKFPTYGRLSRLDTREIRVGARVASDEYAKENPSDFALWKKADALDEQVGAAWDAPFGRGRPGWHLECSAMSLDEIGRRFGVRTLDIHAGGVDLIFPHHEDEIAQSEAVTGEPFARYWVHGAFMQVGGTKMSKRFGNFLTVRDLQEEGVDAGTFRLLVFQTHYRKELDYNDAALASARDGSRRLDIFRDRLRTAGGLQEDEPFRALAETLKTRVTEALDDDLNAPRAVAALFDFVTEGNRLLDTGVRPGERVLAAWRWVDAVLDLCPTPPPVDDELVRWVEERIAARTRARGAR
ncbi:MAG: cysteine--tRNA ligase, partial [Gemmatimonadota bacterium]